MSDAEPAAGSRALRRAYGLLAVGVLVVIAGGLLLVGRQAFQQIGSEGRKEIPGVVTFEGTDRPYEILVGARALQGDLTPERLATYVRCEVRLANETVVQIRGDRQAVSSVTDFGATVGAFDGRAGTTTVDCRYTQDRFARQSSNRFIVAAKLTGVRLSALVLFGIGGVLLAIGTWLIVRAYRQR